MSVRSHRLRPRTSVYLCLLRGATHRLLTPRACERLLASYRAIPPNATVRLAKPTSNLFRARAKNTTQGPGHLGADAASSPSTPRRAPPTWRACAPTRTSSRPRCPYGLSPLVVPQLKTITLGGAVTGLGIESASFRNGLPHESVLEMDILTGTGEVVTASPRPAPRSLPRLPEFLWHAWLFGAAEDRAGARQAVRRAAAPAVPLVGRPGRGDGPHHRDRRPRRRARRLPRRRGVQRRRELPVHSACRPRRPDPSATTPASRSTTARSSTADGEKHDRLTIHDYLWRWDTDWFWCSRAFGAQNPRIRRFWPRRYRRSSFYWKLIGYDQRFNIADRIEKRNGRPPLERVVQDIEVPIERTAPSSSTGSWTTCRSSRSGCARCGCATTTDWPLYPIRAAPHLRQRRLLVVGAGRRHRRATPTG